MMAKKSKKKDKNVQSQTSEEQSASALLTSEERRVCEQLKTSKAPWSQRAQALLAVDEGASDEMAGETASLSANQVKYWVAAFRRQRTNLFPESLLMEVKLTPDVSESDNLEENTPSVEVPEKSAKSKKSSRTKDKDKKNPKKKKRKNKDKKTKDKKKSK